MIYITRREVFSASHRLYNPGLSEAENCEIYDKCSNPNGHGHNYVLEVMVAGEIDPKTGYLLDLKKLKRIIKENVTDKLDHKNLNLDVDFMEGIIPTSENICIAIWNQLEGKIPAGKLYSVKLYETENNYIEYKGEKYGE
ncbi:MAG: 6-carboxytetrahydropterin synthase [Ignavibacteriales bacterium]|jgi:6-pyruvoyltetrahydropterin/6-carboxytetrahydropterin synthase|nr:6-carboxytetrahydropterin synthase [Ignavibacteriaceae bacterium]NLH61106.1 6-carboxytetrahydropterin synthase [Ignavibacteriales bacterium]HOJ17589.1 6-carboxytetrahydropterin synthase [Ignavibacteriaceae bacterium]HPO55937.1 6-carboxytetrahydropterin synthase [Ignavibacteriaceae bacterium]